MKEIQKNKANKADKEFPGCLGRMVNLSAGPSATRLLKDKPHSNGITSLFPPQHLIY